MRASLKPRRLVISWEMRKILPVPERSENLHQMDTNVAEWIQTCWERGDGLSQVSDALCAVHHYEPWTRKQLPESWKVFSVWRKLETPDRAPPLTQHIVNSWIMYSISHCNLDFAAMLALGFYALPRTGECLQVRPCDLLLQKDAGIVSLSETNTGLRNAAKETVRIDNPLALEILMAVVASKREQNLDRVPIWTKSAQSF